MLLRIGVAMMLVSVALAAVITVAVGHSGRLGGEEITAEEASLEPLAAEVEAQEKNREFDPGQKLEIVDEPREEPEVEPLPIVPEDWPQPSGEEIVATQAPRYYPPRRDSALTLTVEAMGLHGVPVISSKSPQALDNGVIHHPQTPLPWDERSQKNVYLAGHRLGYPGTGSRLVFYNLDKMKKGDTVVLRDGRGDPYEYRVSEVFVVEPNADWVVDPVRGRDMVTLQSCTMPDFRNRIIVRADRT